MSALSGIVARIRASPPWVDLTLASALTIAGLLEVLLGGAADGSRLASALAIPLVTLPLALRRRHPLLPAAAIAVALLAQGAFDGFLIGHAVTPLVALVVALYSAGRHVAGTRGLAGAAALVAALVATRVAFDPSVERVADAALTLLYVPLPLLVGRWARGQVELRHGLEAKIEQLERERVRGARQAAEDERVRITSDLQELVAGGLGEIVERAQALSGSLRGGDRAHAPATFASIAATARDVLDDVRRVLGILRREDEAAPLAPPLVGTDDAHTSARQSDPGARIAGDPPAGRATRPDPSPPIAGDALGDGAARAHLSPPIAGSTPRRAAIGPDRASPRPAAPLRPGALQRLPRWPRALAGDGRRIDRLLVAALLAGAEIELAIQAPDDLRLPAALTAIAITAPLLGRRRQPVLVFAAVLGAVAVQSAVLDLDAFPAFDIAALVCATYAIGAHADRRAAIGGLVLAALGAATHAAVFYPAGIVPALLGGVTLPWIVGRTVRGHRRLTAEAAEKAARDEQARAQEARAATTAERMRVARELHDAVAHSISVIAIQAAGAEPLVARDPERAARCAELIAQVGREALVELGRLLEPREPAVGGELAAAPQPSLADVEALAARARDSGLRVELRVEGAPVALPAGVDLAAYRIVQEALTNTAKHAGPTRARVVVRYEERAVALEVGDDGRGPAAPPAPAPAPNGVAGHGLAGMRERVALYGGTLDVGRRPGGGFRVQARLPIGRRERGTVGSHAQPSPRSGRMPSTASRRATVGNDDAERRPPR